MSKSNFLLVDLNEAKTKKLAETITSNTSRKILNHLTEKEHDTEANIAKESGIPISTVHYHLNKLMQAKLVKVEEFHYSPKGREVNHYKLANKYIIIAPQKVSGLRQALKNVLPVGLVALGISAVIKFVQSFGSVFKGAGQIGVLSAEKAAPMVADLAQDEAMMEAGRAAPEMAQAVPEATQFVTQTSPPDIAFWFFIGSMVTILVYLAVVLVKEYIKKR